LLHPDCSCYRDKVNRAAGRCTGALFFARHLDYFIMTRNFTAIYLDLVLSKSFTVTRDYSSVYQDWQKTRHRDADGTSLNRRAVMFNSVDPCMLDCSIRTKHNRKARPLYCDNSYPSTRTNPSGQISSDE
jgi:hypothetical protein